MEGDAVFVIVLGKLIGRAYNEDLVSALLHCLAGEGLTATRVLSPDHDTTMLFKDIAKLVTIPLILYLYFGRRWLTITKSAGLSYG